MLYFFRWDILLPVQTQLRYTEGLKPWLDQRDRWYALLCSAVQWAEAETDACGWADLPSHHLSASTKLYWLVTRIMWVNNWLMVVIHDDGMAVAGSQTRDCDLSIDPQCTNKSTQRAQTRPRPLYCRICRSMDLTWPKHVVQNAVSAWLTWDGTVYYSRVLP